MAAPKRPSAHVVRVPFPKSTVAAYVGVNAILEDIRSADTRIGGSPLAVLPSGNRVLIGYSLRALSILGAWCRGCGIRASVLREHRVAPGRSGVLSMARCGNGFIRIDVDHAVPRSRGGASVMGNLLPLCGACGTRKDDANLFLAEPRYRIADIRRLLIRDHVPDHLGLAAFEQDYVARFEAAPDFGDGYLSASALRDRLEDIRKRFGLSCDTAGLRPHMFPCGVRPDPGGADSVWLRELADRMWTELEAWHRRSLPGGEWRARNRGPE